MGERTVPREAVNLLSRHAHLEGDGMKWMILQEYINVSTVISHSDGSTTRKDMLPIFIETKSPTSAPYVAIPSTRNQTLIDIEQRCMRKLVHFNVSSVDSLSQEEVY
ncbi:hypothetical protein BWQ96_02889 [Gracilariopsis chorda]|uniref:Uncharacterized protein n=1 Tax=Gracilariopsis chorda TaxID=448386 RepID=A0A2V3IYP3_9FLOR|nr:hypothetical protein BWQ96_02889 [Gracilariopsis chorda]|eukprot:PXF47276.1 hypothetical protein BWQ96_02889 [Gracilariopsis chorda]